MTTCTPPKATPASKPLILQGKAKAPVNEIVIHTTDTPHTWMKGHTLREKYAEIRRWHMVDNKWADFAYHYLMDNPTGEVLAGRLETVMGAGVMGHNSGVIHIALIGGRGSKATDSFSKHYGEAMNKSLQSLIRSIGKRTTILRVRGHNDYAAKACPGFKVEKWLADQGGLARILR